MKNEDDKTKIKWIGRKIRLTPEDRKKLDDLFKRPYKFFVNHPRRTGKTTIIKDAKEIGICTCPCCECEELLECGGYCE
jgi:predicted AAA+ superfamily ATPase